MKDLVLLHGALGADTLFQPLMAELTGFRCYTFNFSGHGGAPFSTKGFGIEVFARELEKFLDDQRLKEVPVFGYSTGGYVALYLELTRPGTFSQIVTLGTKFDWKPETAQHEASRMVPEVIKNKVPKFASLLSQRHGDHWEQLMEATVKMMIGLGNAPLLNEQNLTQLKAPSHIMLGDGDQMVSPQESKKVSQTLPNGHFEMLTDTPHPLEKVNATMLASKLRALI